MHLQGWLSNISGYQLLSESYYDLQINIVLTIDTLA